MKHYVIKSLKKGVKAKAMILLISLCLTSISYSEEKDVYELIQQLKDKNSFIRQKAALALGVDYNFVLTGF